MKFKHLKLFWLLALVLSAAQLWAAQIGGSVTSKGKPLSEVILSDGVHFARTGSDGRFEMELADDAPFVWVVTPSGYTAPYPQGVPQFFQSTDGRTHFDFVLDATPNPFTLLAIGDPQPKTERHLDRLKKEEMPDFRATVRAAKRKAHFPVMLILGDVVWDSPHLSQPIREALASAKAPIYTVIGNHDHLIAESDDSASATNYRRIFGPTYYAFDLGNTHFVVLDNIIYHGHKVYEEGIDDAQVAWLEAYLKFLPAGSRICIAMHAPAQKYWRDNVRTGNVDRLLALLTDYEVHFITGHSHINSNFDVTPTAIEHNVAQVSGNLWRAPLNSDGTPRGYQLFFETDKGLEWRYKTLGKDDSYQIQTYAPGRVVSHPDEVVAKVWNWDPHWTVTWRQDGEEMGVMKRLERLADPDYLDHLAAQTKKAAQIPGAKRPKDDSRPAFFYFTAAPNAQARKIEVVATDRFGNRYTQTLKLPR